MSIQIEEVRRLKLDWDGKECPNRHLKHTLEKEYHLGSHTGDYACPICGESFWEDDPKINK